MARWNKHEQFRQQARKEGYRSRAAYKLLEIEKRFKLLQKAKRVVDLCSAPGSWLQVIRQICKDHDVRIVGVDKVAVKPVEGVKIIQGNIEAPELITLVDEFLDGPADVVLSDCAPKLTGNKTLDRERQIWQAQLSLRFAIQLLKRDGHFVTKVFQSEPFRGYISRVRTKFKMAKTFKPESSFSRSPEIYLIAKRFRKTS